MKKHSTYLEKKKDFALQNNALSDEQLDFYNRLFLAQERTIESLPDNMQDFLPVAISEFPLLVKEDIKLNSDIISSLELLFDEIAGAVRISNPGMDFTLLRGIFADSSSDMLISLLSQDFDYFEKKASECRMDISELLFMIHNVFKPLLVKAGKTAGVSVEKEDWLQGNCPFCGYLPDFSKIVESKDNMRMLHCSLCENEWVFPRLKCPSCDNDEQSSLGFFEYEDNTDYRVYYCDKCRTYIKSIRVPKLREESGYDLAVEDVVTGFLDSSMINKNYNRQ